MTVIGHTNWCTRQGEPANVSRNFCSMCGERVKLDQREAEEDRLRRQLEGAVERAETAEAEVKRLRGLLDAHGRSWKQLAAITRGQ